MSVCGCTPVVSETPIPSESSRTSSSHQPDLKMLRAMDEREESTSSPKVLDSSTSSGLLGDGSAAPREHEHPHAGQRGCGEDQPGTPAMERKEDEHSRRPDRAPGSALLPGDVASRVSAPSLVKTGEDFSPHASCPGHGPPTRAALFEGVGSSEVLRDGGIHPAEAFLASPVPNVSELLGDLLPDAEHDADKFVPNRDRERTQESSPQAFRLHVKEEVFVIEEDVKDETEDDAKRGVQSAQTAFEQKTVPEVKPETKEALSRTPAFDSEGPQPSTTSTELKHESFQSAVNVQSGCVESQSDPLGFCTVCSKTENSIKKATINTLTPKQKMIL